MAGSASQGKKVAGMEQSLATAETQLKGAAGDIAFSDGFNDGTPRFLGVGAILEFATPRKRCDCIKSYFQACCTIGHSNLPHARVVDRRRAEADVGAVAVAVEPVAAIRLGARRQLLAGVVLAIGEAVPCRSTREQLLLRVCVHCRSPGSKPRPQPDPLPRLMGC